MEAVGSLEAQSEQKSPVQGLTGLGSYPSSTFTCIHQVLLSMSTLVVGLTVLWEANPRAGVRNLMKVDMRSYSLLWPWRPCRPWLLQPQFQPWPLLSLYSSLRSLLSTSLMGQVSYTHRVFAHAISVFFFRF